MTQTPDPPPHGATPPPRPESTPPPPAYPGVTPSPPAYPGATPSPPTSGVTPPPPAYPGTTPSAPAYPGATPAPPQAGPVPEYPYAAAIGPAAPGSGDPTHPHHIDTGPRRVHLSAHQRGADLTAVGNLLLYVPHFLCSLLIVSLVSVMFGRLGLIVVLLWLASGAFVFHRPTESAIARHLLRLRYPTHQERLRLEPVWQEVTARAGVDAHTYELWVEDSDSLNAVAAAGHIVGITSYAMDHLPNGELAAVMAHELGHHVGGHAWSSLLGYWYALPSRVVWRVLRAVMHLAYRVSRSLSCFGTGLVILVLGGIALQTLTTLHGLPMLLLAMPYALAAVGRRAELRADRHAAALGFAPMLASVLDKLHRAEQQHTAARATQYGVRARTQDSPLNKLLSSHPDHHTRLHHLQPYLRPPRP